MTIDEYAAELGGGIGQGLGDVGRAAVADIGDSYQEILLADSAISAPDPVIETEISAPEPEPYEPPAMDLNLC